MNLKMCQYAEMVFVVICAGFITIGLADSVTHYFHINSGNMWMHPFLYYLGFFSSIYFAFAASNMHFKILRSRKKLFQSQQITPI